MELIDQHIEALIFSAESNITQKEIKATLDSTFEDPIKAKEVLASLDRIKVKFEEETFSFELVKINNGYTFMTKGMFHDTIGNHLKKVNKKKLSRAALETLAIIAYKQPVTKVEVESIRGVNCDYVVQKLLEKELVEIAGRSDSPGRPLIYRTSSKFMDYFGISDVNDLPKPKDFAIPETEIGEPAPIEEDVITENQNEEANPGPSKTIADNADQITTDSPPDGEVNNDIEVVDPAEDVIGKAPISEEAVEVEEVVDNDALPERDETNNDSEDGNIADESTDETIEEENSSESSDQNEISDVSAYIEAEKEKIENGESKPFTVYETEASESEDTTTQKDNTEEE